MYIVEKIYEAKNLDLIGNLNKTVSMRNKKQGSRYCQFAILKNKTNNRVEITNMANTGLI